MKKRIPPGFLMTGLWATAQGCAQTNETTKSQLKTLLRWLIFGLIVLSSKNVNAQHQMNTTADALLIERTEMDAWSSLIDAVPDSLKLANGMKHQNIGGGMLINFQKMPVPLFNRAIGFGLTEPFTPQVLDSIRAFYAHRERYIVHYSAPMQPAGADSLLKQNGFFLAGAWERVVRDGGSLSVDDNNNPPLEIKQVDEQLKEDWVRFLIDTYGYDFYWWPRSFAFQKGWKHYVAFRNGKIVACRSFFTSDKKTIFSGVDAPVPGVMTTDYAPDFAIWEKAIQDGLKEGAVMFVADIELPDKEKNKTAYDNFKKLGFIIPYTRYHYRLNR